jgi:hypothetical protein
MACTRNLLKIWVEAVLLAIVGILFPTRTFAEFASQFSFSVGEAYSDNIFFTKSKEHDFVTVITPGLTLFYAPAGQVLPTLNLNIAPAGLIFARHPEFNGFGNNISLNGGYTYQYSPRLSFNLSDTFARQGDQRTPGFTSGSQGPTPPTVPPPVGGTVQPPFWQNLSSLLFGSNTSNYFALQGTYLYRPEISFTGGYSNSYVKSEGGNDLYQTIGVRGVYNWRTDHNLHAGYWISIINSSNNSNNGSNGVVHNFDFGDDYFSNYSLQLTPTLSVTASSGLSINTTGSGPTVGNNTNITLTKLWETATLSAGIQKGLTPTLGVGGISDTTNFFANFGMRLTEKLLLNSSANFSLYTPNNVNFSTFQAGLGFQYLINTWLSSALSYNFNWISSGAGASTTNLLERGVVNSNSVILSITSRFDLWPNVGLARSMTSPSLTPVLRTPFPAQAPATSTTPP